MRCDKCGGMNGQHDVTCRSVTVIEVQRRADIVVDAAIAWHESGQEGDDLWFEKSEVLSAAINSLLELRSPPKSTRVSKCPECGHSSFSGELQRCVKVIHVQDGEFQCGCKCSFPASTEVAGEQWPSEHEAEEILREHGTSGKEVVNGFIDQVLRERLRFEEAIKTFIHDRGKHEGEHVFDLTACRLCDESYIQAEALLDAVVESAATAPPVAQPEADPMDDEYDAEAFDEFLRTDPSAQYAMRRQWAKRMGAAMSTDNLLDALKKVGCSAEYPDCSTTGIMNGSQWVCANHAVSTRLWTEMMLASTTTPATAAVEAARAISSHFGLKFQGASIAQAAAIISKHLPAQQPEVSGLADAPRLSHQEDTLMTKNYDGFRAGMLRAAEMARNEFKRAPEAAKGEDCVWMGGYESACDHLSIVIAQAAVIDSVRIAGAQPDWQYHIALLLPGEGIEDQALLKIYQVVEHELRKARADVIGECVKRISKAAHCYVNVSSSGSADYVSGFANGAIEGAKQVTESVDEALEQLKGEGSGGERDE